MTSRSPRRLSANLFLLAGLAACAALAWPSAARADQIYRCERNGKVTLTDTPCDGRPAAPATAPDPGAGTPLQIDLAYQSAYGEWRGQAQYRANAGGLPIPGAFQVVPTILTISRDGKLSGASPGNGCRLSGLAYPSFSEQALNVDLTAQDCRATVLNQRYTGTLSVNPRTKVALLSLHSQTIGVLTTPKFFELKATLRR